MNSGLRTSPLEVTALATEAIEAVEIGPNDVDGILLERELEQRGRVATGHAGNDCTFACHHAVSFR